MVYSDTLLSHILKLDKREENNTAKLLNCSLTKTQAALSVPTFYVLVTEYHAFLMNCIIV